MASLGWVCFLLGGLCNPQCEVLIKQCGLCCAELHPEGDEEAGMCLGLSHVSLSLSNIALWHSGTILDHAAFSL